jgi:periplasmic copper chaperone A
VSPLRTLSLMAVMLAAAASAAVAQQEGGTAALRVRDAWARPSMPGRPMSAAYAIVENPGTAPVVLSAVSCAGTASAELHESFEENGMMRMRPVPTLAVPPGGQVELRPGGYHVMLMGLTRALAQGDRVRCELRAGTAVVARFEAEVRAP